MKLDETQVAAAIGRAEDLTSGEIRVYFSRRHVDDGLAAARVQFEKLGMSQTRERNAVLIFIAPKSRQFAIVGDTGIDAKCPEGFWNSVRDEMAALLVEGKHTEAIVRGVEMTGKLLAQHFPRSHTDVNELPDQPVQED